MSFLEDIAKGGAEGILSPINKAIQIFKADATQQAQLDAALAQAKIQLETTTIAAVNASIQAEAKSEHWMVWSWRPTVGFTFSGLILNNYVLLPYLAPYGMKSIDIPTEIWQAMLVVLGVAAGTRGWEKVTKAQKN